MPSAEDQKAVITELVNKITVHFDRVTNKHRIDVEFQRSVQIAMALRLSAQPGCAADTVECVGEHCVTDNVGEVTGEGQLTAEKPGVGQSTQGTEPDYSVTVE